MRAVLDTNVVLSSAISRGGLPAEIVLRWEAGSLDWVSSAALIAELERAFGYPRIQRHLSSRFDIDPFLDQVRGGVVLVEPDVELNGILRDHADHRVLEAALAGEADYIVSGDKDLLSLGSYEGIDIVTPGQLLAILATAEM